MKIIDTLAASLSESISERGRYNLEEVALMIAARIKSSIRDILAEHATQEEREYNKLVELQATQRVGSPDYVATGYKLSTLKHRKSLANRAASEAKKGDALQILKDFVRNEHGIDKLRDLLKDN